jgi:hypothetical protein
MTDAPIPAPQTVDTVVRAFTEAELALADITSSIARFQSASDQLAAAGLASDAATDALKAAVAASDRIAAQVGALTSTIGEAASALRAVDPDRLWAHLEAVERRRADDQATNARTARRAVALAAIGAAAAVVSALILVLLLARVIAL